MSLTNENRKNPIHKKAFNIQYMTITIIFEHALNESDFIMDIVRLEFKRREAINTSYKY